jgi:hypothetical protein
VARSCRQKTIQSTGDPLSAGSRGTCSIIGDAPKSPMKGRFFPHHPVAYPLGDNISAIVAQLLGKIPQ